MKKPLLLAAVLCFAASLGFATTHAGSHSGTHSSHPRSSSSHHSHRASRVRVPHTRRHVTYEEKKILFDHAGIPKSQWHNYIVDHRIPLELGGSNDLSNLQIQDKTTAHRKDRVENYLASRVRSGQMSLSEAQAEIQHWEAVPTPG
jgi:hypothetical protein